MVKRAAQFAMLLALCPILSFAQSGDQVTRGGLSSSTSSSSTSISSSIETNEDSALSLLSIVLHLSDSQQQQLRAAFDLDVKAAMPIISQMDDSKTAFFQAIRSQRSEDEIKKLAEEQGKLTSQMLLLQSQAFARLWSVLNDEQRSQLDEFVYDNIRTFLPVCPQ
jgi:hypothetical protein